MDKLAEYWERVGDGKESVPGTEHNLCKEPWVGGLNRGRAGWTAGPGEAGA